MNKAYRYRLYPTAEQKIMFAKTFGCVRFIYNKMLQSAIKAMMNNGLDVATIATSLGITAGEVEALMAK